MIKMSLIQRRDVQSITINGAWVFATINGKATEVRTVHDDNWYDQKHSAVMDAVYQLEAALDRLIPKTD